MLRSHQSRVDPAQSMPGKDGVELIQNGGCVGCNDWRDLAESRTWRDMVGVSLDNSKPSPFVTTRQSVIKSAKCGGSTPGVDPAGLRSDILSIELFETATGDIQSFEHTFERVDLFGNQPGQPGNRQDDKLLNTVLFSKFQEPQSSVSPMSNHTGFEKTGWTSSAGDHRIAAGQRQSSVTAPTEEFVTAPLLNIVLYQPEIPQNTGNIGRTCAAIGGKLWLVRPLGFQITDRHLKRAGMDYWDQLDYEIVDSWRDVLKELPESNVWYLTKTAMRLVWDAQFKPGDILLFGSESQGLPPSILNQHPAGKLKLPMVPSVRSLNLASTVNAVVYEAVRQFGGLADSGGVELP